MSAAAVTSAAAQTPDALPADGSSGFSFEPRFGLNHSNTGGIGFHRDSTVVDVDGDGDKDVVSAYTNTLRTHRVNGPFTNSSYVSQTTQIDSYAASISRLGAGDFDGDGDEDVVSPAGAYLSDGAGGFVAAATFEPGAADFDLDVADFDQDGRLDVALVAGATADPASPPDTFRLRFGRGDGTFGDPTDYTVPRRHSYRYGGGQPVQMEVADFNGDGAPDLAVVDGVKVHVYVNNGEGTLRSPASITLSDAVARVAAADVNNDFKQDLVVTTAGGVRILVGDGNAVFSDVGGAPAAPLGMLEAGDLDGDRNVDLVVASTTFPHYLFVARGGGDGSFSDPQRVGELPDAPGSIHIADINGDDKPDLTLWSRCFCFPASLALSTTPQVGPPDRDDDGLADDADNCASESNADQADQDGDGAGDACDADRDGDAVANASDNCADASNGDQSDADADDLGDACDPDRDGDAVSNVGDNCQDTPNADQADQDRDAMGDACDADRDGDAVPDGSDNCVAIPNADQGDVDADEVGDRCDVDRDGDGDANDADNCPDATNADQFDWDNDGLGDACDSDRQPAQRISALSEAVEAMALHHGTTNSLTKKLQAALEAYNSADIEGACLKLDSFVHEVRAQAGKKIPTDDADGLLSAAAGIKTALGCLTRAEPQPQAGAALRSG